MKKTNHWLHIILTLLTGGLWLGVYLICVILTREHNIGYRTATQHWGNRQLEASVKDVLARHYAETLTTNYKER